MKTVSALLVVGGVIWLSIFGFTWLDLVQQVGFHVSPPAFTVPIGWPDQTQFVTTTDGFKIAYWYFPAPQPRATVILIHGYDNPGGKSQMLNHAEYLRAAGYSTALIDLRSFGESQGQQIGLGTAEWQDVAAVYDALKAKPENDGVPIGLFGLSMGGVTAIVTNGETGKGDFVIASVPYSNLDSFFQSQYHKVGLPAPILQPLKSAAAHFVLGRNLDRFSASRQIQNVEVPIFLISAKQDIEVDPDDAWELFQQASEPKVYWQADAKHNIFHAQPEQYQAQIVAFLEKYAQK